MNLQLRPAVPADQEGIVALIDTVYREYGDQIFLEDADGDLLDIAGSYFSAGGIFIVLDDGKKVRGSHAVKPVAQRPGVVNFRRLFLDAQLRGSNWGDRLMQWALDWTKEHGYGRVEFWSDTRFERAHHFFGRHGFEKDGRVREMSDGWMAYREYFFFQDL